MSGVSRILVAAHDNGALNVLQPLLNAWVNRKDLDIQFLSTPSVLRDMQEQISGLRSPAWAGRITESIAASRSDLDSELSQYLDKNQWDAIVCGTSRLCLLEKRLLKAAKTLGIYSFSFCDMWWAYQDRFRDGDEFCLPDTLWVIDSRMASEAALALPEFLKIKVVGSPFFEETSTLRMGKVHSICVDQSIRFFSEPVSGKFPDAGIDEFELAGFLVDVCRSAGINHKIVVRPHPLDDVERWRRWVWSHRHQEVELDVEPLEVCMTSTKFAVGISSIILTETSMSGIPTASIKLIGADPDYYCLPFQEFGIRQVTSSEDLISWLLSDAKELNLSLAKQHEGAIDLITASMLNQLSQKP